MRHLPSFLLPICILCIPLSATTPQQMVDALGNELALSSPPKRIISLAPNITEILFALGLDERIVGVTRFCDFPERALKKEKIGGMTDPSLEKIIALNPDLVIGFRGNPIRLLNRMKDLEIPLFALETGETIESVYGIISTIGLITHSTESAGRLVDSLKQRHQNIKSVLIHTAQKPRIFIMIHGMGLWTCGRDSFLTDLVNKAKAENIAGRIPRKWLLYNREQLLHENPDFIIVLSRSPADFRKAKKWITEEAHLESLSAVTSNQIFLMDENLASRPGPRILEALEILVRMIHPECFPQ